MQIIGGDTNSVTQPPERRAQEAKLTWWVEQSLRTQSNTQYGNANSREVTHVEFVTKKDCMRERNLRGAGQTYYREVVWTTSSMH